MCYLIQACVGWTYGNNKYLSGQAKGDFGHGVTKWSNKMYNDLETAKRACIKLGNACGGVTGQETGGYSVRSGSTFKTPKSPTGEFSFIKPNNPCL